MKERNKFKAGFVRGIREQEEAAEEQRTIKRKNGIPEDTDILVVEKSNMAKFTVNTVKAMIRLAATIILLVLAAIGLVSLIYPDTRQSLYTILTDVIAQIKGFFRI